MTEYLIFRLYGHMAAWGDIAVGEYRPTFSHPGKSAVLGLIAASLGIRRNEEAQLLMLTESYSFAVHVEESGSPMKDYHTAQVPPSGKKTVYPTRRAELSAARLNTILSSRDYRCDALYTVMIWGNSKELPFSLKQISYAFKKPIFSLYLGRKSCPLSLPLQPQLIKAKNLKKALSHVIFKDDDFLGDLELGESTAFYWEGKDDSFNRHHEIIRRDSLLSGKRRQFAERAENFTAIEKED